MKKKAIIKEYIDMQWCSSCKPWFIVCDDDCPIGCKPKNKKDAKTS